MKKLRVLCIAGTLAAVGIGVSAAQPAVAVNCPAAPGTAVFNPVNGTVLLNAQAFLLGGNVCVSAIGPVDATTVGLVVGPVVTTGPTPVSVGIFHRVCEQPASGGVTNCTYNFFVDVDVESATPGVVLGPGGGYVDTGLTVVVGAGNFGTTNVVNIPTINRADPICVDYGTQSAHC